VTAAEQAGARLLAFPWARFGEPCPTVHAIQYLDAVHVWLFAKDDKGVVREAARTFRANPEVGVGSLASLVADFLGINDMMGRGEVSFVMGKQE